MIQLKGTKIVEVPYFSNQMVDNTKSVLIIGERWGGIEGISETVKELGFSNVNTTDILEVEEGAWLKKETNWKHLKSDFIEFDESNKYDYIISVSVFEHFGFWFAGNRMANGLSEDDKCYWNHDIKGINKACKLLKDQDSKLMITLPAGPYMNYEKSGEPFLRYYNKQRQNIIKSECEIQGYTVNDEKFYYSENFQNWQESEDTINNPEYYQIYNPWTPNVIWAFTIQKK